MSLYRKKLVLTLFLLIGIALVFWTGSRYPQLNTKALMGVDSPNMGISFDIVKAVQEDHSAVEKILYNTINWIDTNKKGMTFGFLFGAAFILLFSIIKDLNIKNRFLNTTLGAVIGAPLGVCVNCAAPIAKGMKDAGAKTETALATMITSPTMNIIVLSMLFSLLPIYLVWLKIGFTLLFIFLVIPLVSRLFKEKEKEKSLKAPKPNKLPTFQVETDSADKLVSSNWWSALVWTLKGYLKSLWFIVKTTLPLMILAGLLGNVLITFLPLESLIGLVKNLSLVEKGVYMLCIALFATFLPVPIAFDVIITAILWSTGLHTRFAAILLFCLGTYSIYSAFIVGKSFSLKLSVMLFLVTAAFGFSAGVAGHFIEKEMGENYRLESYEQFKASNTTPNYLLFDNELEEGIDYEKLKDQLSTRKKGELIYKNEALQCFKYPFEAQKNSNQEPFTKIEGKKIGLTVPYHFSVKEVVDPFANQRSIAVGDVHRDGYPDLLFVSAENLLLYANLNGKEFKRQALPSFKTKSVFNAALVDFDNDGWQDIFFSTYRNGNYILKNDSGSFNSNSLIRLVEPTDLILTMAPAFSDMDKDGLLDIVLGNWSLGLLGAPDYSIKESKNYWLKNIGNFQFELMLLDGIDGETLSVLMADINDDQQVDMVVGNDFNVPDNYYLRNKQGELIRVSDPESLVEKSTNTTMSVIHADIDNDLVYEIFQAQIDRIYGDAKTDDPKLICDAIGNEEDRKECEKLIRYQQQTNKAIQTRRFENCPDEFGNDCVGAELIRSYTKGFNLKASQYFKDNWKDYLFISKFNEREHTKYPRVKEGSYEHKMQGGLLLQKDSTGRFIDKTKQYGLMHTGWTWNAKFSDIDNDGWQDLYVVNGYLLQPAQETNLFYKNNRGKNFEDKTEELGLINRLPTSSYSYVDFDLDGDLDLMMVSSVGPVFLYENNHHKNKSISFELLDETGNRNGVGTTITIYYGDGLHQKREILLSGGFKSFDETIAYFGLGTHTKISRVKVDWSNGEQTIIEKELEAGARYLIKKEKE